MTRQKKIDPPVNGKPKGRAGKHEPLTDRIKEAAMVRALIHNGAFFGRSLSDEEHVKAVGSGGLTGEWRIVKKSEFSNPQAVGIVHAEGMGAVEIRMELSNGKFRNFISGVLRKAGVAEEFVRKVGEVEVAMNTGDVELVNRLCKFEPYDAEGGMEKL